MLRAVGAAFRELSDERAGACTSRSASAVPLTEEQQERLQDGTARHLQHSSQCWTSHVDPELLGGMTVQVGDWLFDGTVRSRLERLRNQLMAGSSQCLRPDEIARS